MQAIKHLYIHVPFCASKCEYCAFFSAPGNETQMTGFVDAVLVELSRWADHLAPTTIFIGGGTPSLLPLPLWERFLTGLRPYLVLLGMAEWTVECNPATVDTAKAQLWRSAGINRISLGVQAFDDALLKTLGRIHTAGQAVETYRLLRAAGFTNINLDLMFGLPGQTAAQWRDTLRRAIELAPEHISAYNLMREDGTAFANLTPNDELEREFFELGIALLTAAGYRHYEISNFAKPGCECRHNIAYWEGADYLGLGPSAVSTVGLRRWTDGGDEEQLTGQIKRAERVAFGLRMLDGVPGELVRGRWDSEVAGLISTGLVQWHDDRLQLTRRGLLFADEVAAEFV